MELKSFTKFLFAAALALCQLDTHATSQAPVAAEHGMVDTAHHLAANVGGGCFMTIQLTDGSMTVFETW